MSKPTKNHPAYSCYQMSREHTITYTCPACGYCLTVAVDLGRPPCPRCLAEGRPRQRFADQVITKER